MRKMRLKKKKNNHLSFLFIIFALLAFVFKFQKQKLNVDNAEFISDILYISNSHLNPELSKNPVYDFIDVVSNIEVTNPVSIMDKVFAYEKKNIDPIEFSYIQNTIVDNPRVYIYSTHPNESYSDGFNVVDASLLLQEKLNSIGIQTIVEPRNVVSYMKENKISDSYSTSRVFVKDALNDYDYDLIIDLHRDQVSNNVSTTTLVNGKEYAKVMFVINTSYKENFNLATKMSNIISKDYKDVTRGIYKKYIDSFNQDLSSNVLLIELGSTKNDSSEVSNSIDILVEAIKELLNEREKENN